MDAQRVSFPLTLLLLSSSGNVLPLEAELQYSSTDPLAVVALFDTGEDAPIRWVFARDLLIGGLERRTGDGDVAVYPATGVDGDQAVRIRLRSPDGDALLEAGTDSISQFLAQTWRLVVPGAEGRLLDIDSVLGALLDRG